MNDSGTSSTNERRLRQSSRDLILASIRGNLAASSSLNTVRKENGINEPTPGISLSRETLINNFKKNLESVGGYCEIVPNENAAAAVVRNAIERLSATRIAISDSPLVASVIENSSDVELTESADPEYLFASDIGITSAQWGIAETGTLVLQSDAERHRLTSLIPPIHICVLEARNIRQTLGELLQIVHNDLSRTVTFITGASRTSDIELTLAIGVHGPRELHVIVINDQLS